MRKAVMAILLLLGVALMVYRAFAGLGAVTALSDYQPWGLVKAVNVFTCAALAAGSFAVAAAYYVFGISRMRPLVRPALLTGFIGHSLVLVALLYDVGRPLDVWHIIIHPQGRSALLWTAWCEAAYTSAMAAELLPGALKDTSGIRSLLEFYKVPLVIFSAALAVVYQSTLGTLLLAPAQSISPLWYGPALPVLFLLSALVAGLGMLVIESYASARAGRRPLDQALMAGVCVAMAVVLALYLAVRVGALLFAGDPMAVMDAAARGGVGPIWFAAEITLGGVLPLLLIVPGAIRRSAGGLFFVAALCVLGVFMNRAGVTIIGWRLPPGEHYTPSLMEVYASFFFLLAAAALYWLLSGTREGAKQRGAARNRLD